MRMDDLQVIMEDSMVEAVLEEAEVSNPKTMLTTLSREDEKILMEIILVSLG